MEPTSANLVLYSLKRVILTLITSTSMELSSNLWPLTQVCVFFFSMLNVILSWSDPWLCVLRGHWLSPQILRWTRPWQKKGSLCVGKEKCPCNESFNWIWARATNSWRYESNWTFSIFESERIDQFIPSKLYVDCLCAYYLIPFACLPPPPSSPSFTDTTEDWRETSWVCSDFDVQMKMLGGVITSMQKNWGKFQCRLAYDLNLIKNQQSGLRAQAKLTFKNN